jgi:drug/metabolite transporter (DMT)-like permease
MAPHEVGAATRRLQIALALAIVYLVWGSTYLAIRFAIETLPPLLMASARFLLAGGLLYAWSRWRGAERPQGVHWRSAAVVGGLLLFVGNGIVVWAEQWVDSGLTALLV